MDISPKQRELAKKWFYDHPKLNCSEIIALSSEQEKGSIDLICRAMNIPLDEAKKIKSNITESKQKEEYRELFEMVDRLNGCITAISSHPAGVLVSDLNIQEELGLITIKDKDDPKGFRVVCQLNMKELEELGYVKADALGLANIGVINQTFKYIGKERLNPQTCDFNDENVWNEIKKSPVGIFQFEAEASHKQLCVALENIHDADKIQIMSMTSGIIRPSGASIRNDYLDGKKYDNGHPAINELFKNNSGYIVYQEDIMLFLKEFCGYSDHEADTVRRGIAKKIGTEHLKGEIESRFVDYFSNKYNVDKDRCRDLVQGYLKIVDDASAYGFSYNHALPYSVTGFICGYLRCYYPKEYYTAMLNEFNGKPEKMKEIHKQISENSNITIESPVFGSASQEYSYDKDKNVIYEGLAGLKGVSKNADMALKEIPTNIDSFLDLLIFIKENELKLSQKDLSVLIKIDFFRNFGKQKYLLSIIEIFFNDIKYNAKNSDKTKDKKIGLIKEQISLLNPEDDFNYAEKMKNELIICGRTSKVMDWLDFNALFILSLEHPYPSRYILKGFNMRNGETETYKIDRKDMIEVDENDVIAINSTVDKERKQLVEGKWCGTGMFDPYIKSMSKVEF